MSILDFRDFIRRRDKSGELFRVPFEVDTLDEMGAFIARADYQGIHKPILFEKPAGFDIPVLANTVGHTNRAMAQAFGVDESNALPGCAMKTMEVLKEGGIPPVFVENADAPCKEVILTGDDVDLGLLPVLRLNPQDGQGASRFAEGRFMTSLCASSPREGANNLSYHRLEITSRNSGVMWIFRGTGDAISMQDYWGALIDAPSSTWEPEKGRPFPVAFVFGVTPEFILGGANAALPHEHDDYAFLGGVAGTQVELVKCETQDINVPANAEIVVEGELKPFNWATQGQFASFNGSYDDPRRRPIFDVTGITMRKNPIYQHVHIGLPFNECNSIAAFFRSVKVFMQVKEVLPNLVDVFVDPSAWLRIYRTPVDKKGSGRRAKDGHDARLYRTRGVLQACIRVRR